MFLHNDLTEEQKSIIYCPLDHDLYIEAPAGHGKTTTAMLKASALVEKVINDPHQNVLVLTYSKMAVRQIDFEMHQLVPKQLHSKIAIRTYHSFYFDLIRHYARYIGFTHEDIGLITRKERRSLYLLFSTSHPNLDYLPFSYAQYLVAGLDLPEPIENRQIDERVTAASSFLGNYHVNEHRLGFEDFPFYAYRILAESSFVSQLIACKYPVIFLDEFQNTNDLQWAIIRCFSSGAILIVFADPNQTIYGFRGAGHTIELYKHERNPQSILLTTNFRNSSSLYAFAKGIASGKFDSLPPNNVIFHRMEIYNRDKWKLKFDILNTFCKSITSIAVLTKENRELAVLSDLLARKTEKTPVIPHEIVVDDFSNQDRENLILALFQFISTQDLRYLVVLGSALSACTTGNENYMFYLNQAIKAGRCTPEVIASNKNVPGSNNTRQILRTIQPMLDSVPPEKPEETWQRTELVVQQLGRILTLPSLNTAYENVRGEWDLFFTRQRTTSLEDYMRHIMALRRRQNFLEQRNYLRGLFIMTLHQSQGKQFDAVFIWRCNDGIIPHIEEIRIGDTSPSQYLMYVSITRARHLVHIYYEQNNHYQPSRLIQPFIR